MRAAVAFLRSRGSHPAALVGHSKAGSVVVLYGGTHADMPAIAAVAARFDHSTGVVERFGETVFADVAAAGDGGLPVAWRRRGGEAFEWRLTPQACRWSVGGGQG